MDMMKIHKGIAARIFSLALVLLLFTIVLAVFLLNEVRVANREVQLLRDREIPLQLAIGQIEEAGLRRRLAFERWYGALNASSPHPEIVAEAKNNYFLFTTRVDEAFADALRQLKAYPPGSRDADLAEIRTRLAQLQEGYPDVTRRQKELLALQQSGHQAEVAQQIGLLNDMQSSLQRQRHDLLASVSNLTRDAAADLARRQSRAWWLSLSATVSAVLLGLVVAALISLRLSEPVRALIRAVADVRTGKLDTRLPVHSEDELGELTRSFNYLIQELQEKDHLKKLFGRYVDPRVLTKLLAAEGETLLAGDRQEMTILFADIVGFSDLGERLTPSLLVTVLNRHFTLQAEAVQAQYGVVDKFQGDGLLAFWGAPFVEAGEQARLALTSARAQIKAMERLQSELPELTGLRRDPPTVSIRIGIAKGDVLVGNIGSTAACNFTVIGDSVNLAARVESLNRIYGTLLLLDDNAAAALGPDDALREIDCVVVKGRREATRLFTLLQFNGEPTARDYELQALYKEALLPYRSGDWATAASALRACLAHTPGDGPATALLQRITALHEQPPADWTGVWHLDTK